MSRSDDPKAFVLPMPMNLFSAAHRQHRTLFSVTVVMLSLLEVRGRSNRFLPHPQHLRHGPRLGDAAARREGRVAVKDLAQAAQAMRCQLLEQRLQKGPRGRRVAVDAQVGADKGTDQPAPHGAPVVGSVPRAPVAAIVADVDRILGSEARAGRGRSAGGGHRHPPRRAVAPRAGDCGTGSRQRAGLGGGQGRRRQGRR